VNLLGCFLIGLLYGLSERGHLLNHEWRLFLTVGFCGGFTTFSAFAEENFAMATTGHLPPLLLNVGLSVFVGITAVYLGAMLVRWL
jgi:fluoride exporter